MKTDAEIYDGMRFRLRRPIRFYVSSPYSHGDPEVRRNRVQLVREFVQECMTRVPAARAVFYSPILQTDGMGMDDVPAEYWRGVEKWTVPIFDVLVAFRAPGWRESVGMQHEKEVAFEHGVSLTWVGQHEYEEGCGNSIDQFIDSVRGLTNPDAKHLGESDPGSPWDERDAAESQRGDSSESS